MFCNNCGNTIDAASTSCPRCGTAIVSAGGSGIYANPAAVYSESKLARHLRLLAILWTVYGVLQVIRATTVHFLAHLSRFWVTGPDWTRWAGPWVMGWLAAWLLFNAAFGFAAAWGLHERLSWGRTVAIVAALFALTHPPLGTILGVYTLVVLLSGNAGLQYDRIARA